MASWWRFTDSRHAASRGEFEARGTRRVARLYFPLANEAGIYSWTSPQLHGGPAASHHESLSPPLTADDLPHALAHRDAWIVEPGREPFGLSGLSPEGLRARAAGARDLTEPVVQAGPGWFRLIRQAPGGRYAVQATLWCPAEPHEPVELMWIELINTGRASLTVAPYAAIPIFARSMDNVRDHRHVTALLHRTAITPHGVLTSPTMAFDERGHTQNATRYAVLAFGPRGERPAAIWPTERSFLGENGTFAAPEAVWQRRERPAPDALRHGEEPIGAFRFPARTLRPGARAGYLLISGISQDEAALRRWTRWGRRQSAWSRSLARTQQAWHARAARLAFRTSQPDLDAWLAWVGLQPTLRRLYGNSYLPQFDYGRGGRGWRDLWQDCLALLLTEPDAVRRALLHNIGGVRIDGSNATIIGKDGSFIADRNNIPRTWMDHGAWPTHTTLLYLDQTGDAGILHERRSYFRDPQIFRSRKRDESWREQDGRQLNTAGGAVYQGTVLEHLLVQNATAFFNVGEHNVCRLEGADWNDGLDMASARGESVAFSAFYAWNLARLAGVCRRLARATPRLALPQELALLLDRLPGQQRVDYRSTHAKQARLERYLESVARPLSGKTIEVPLEALANDLDAKHADLAGRIRGVEWVSEGRLGCFNGYYDNAGARVERAAGGRVRMTLTGQVFPLMSGIADERQVDQVIASARRFLRDPRFGGMRLNTDFGAPQPALGRAFSFAYGEKENGAVFSHMAVMYAYALYLRRRPHAGREVWGALAAMALDQDAARMFPGLPEYFNAEGRGMYCYLTGSASWLIYLLLTQVYGIRGSLGQLVIDPQLTREDFGGRREAGVTCRFAGRPLEITVANPTRLDAGRYRVARVMLGGRPAAMQALASGGVQVSRQDIEALPASRTTAIRVALEPARR